MTPSGKETRELSDLERWQIEEIKKGLEEADRGEFASDEEVQQTLKRLTRRSRTRDSPIQDKGEKLR
jgi:predicted transcriptional regulator